MFLNQKPVQDLLIFTAAIYFHPPTYLFPYFRKEHTFKIYMPLVSSSVSHSIQCRLFGIGLPTPMCSILSIAIFPCSSIHNAKPCRGTAREGQAMFLNSHLPPPNEVKQTCLISYELSYGVNIFFSVSLLKQFSNNPSCWGILASHKLVFDLIPVKPLNP